MSTSTIEWTEHTLNAFVGCRRVSEGCTRCYAERTVHRGLSPQHRGLTVMGSTGPRWNGEVNYVPERFDEMLRTKGPKRWFINSLSDLFFEPVPFPTIAALLGMMAVAYAKHGHIAQILTKRPERAVEFFQWLAAEYEDPLAVFQVSMGWFVGGAPDELKVKSKAWERAVEEVLDVEEPFPFWLGVTTENQATANERIPLLLKCPAAIRWLSCEPLLGRIVLDPASHLGGCACVVESLEGAGQHAPTCPATKPRIDWLVWGSESGPGARPMDLNWGASLVEQCANASVPCFTKQIANAVDRKGGNPEHWPARPPLGKSWPREYPQ